MDPMAYMKFLASLIFVLGLMGGLALVLKKFGPGSLSILKPEQRRLRVLEILPLDPRRKAVLLARDNVEHLVIFGPGGETVLETKIPSSSPQSENHDTPKNA